MGGVCIQMEDEIASLAAVLGASVGGVKAMTATSGPGMCLMAEHIGLAIMEEVPCVIVDVQRVGPSTGLVFLSQGDMMLAKWATPGTNEIIALAPCSVREAYELTIKAVNLSEAFRVPVIVLSDAYLGHMREKITVAAPDEVEFVERPRPTVPPGQYLSYDADASGVPPMAELGGKYRSRFVSSTHDTAGRYDPPVEGRRFLGHRLRNKILTHRDEFTWVERMFLDDAEVAVFAYGTCGRTAKAAVLEARARGIKAGLLRPITIWPFPSEAVAEVAERVGRILVVEMNHGQLVREVERAAAGSARVDFYGDDVGQLIPMEKILGMLEGGC